MTLNSGLSYTPHTPDAPGRLIADRPLFADADRTVLLEDGDQDAAWIVAGVAGQTIADDLVRKLGLVERGGKVVQSEDGSSALDVAAPIRSVVTHEAARALTDARIAAEKAAADKDGVVQPDKFDAELDKNTPDAVDADADVKQLDGGKDKQRKGDKKSK